MSNQTQAERSTEVSDTSGVYAFLRRQYHIPGIIAVVAFMFYVRFQNYDAFYGEDSLSLQAVDSWYHWRTTEWAVENYPNMILVDPWTSFPEGHLSGQFGTLFDFIIATVAMIIGLGDPSQNQILLAALITVPAMAALVAVPTFYIGRRLGGTVGGLAGIAILALAPGTFLARTTAGQLQHHVAEVLFMSLAILAMMVALRTAEQDRPIYELVKTKEWDQLKRPAIYSALAGFATLLYILSWPPGVVLVGIFGVFFVIQLSLDFLSGRSPDHVAFVGVVSMLVVSAGTALRIQESGFSATGFDYFQPTFPLLVAGGCVFMAFLARQWEEQGLDRRGYPAAIAGSIVLTIVALAVVLPDVYSTLISNISGRLVPFGHGASALTVQEVQPPSDPADHMFSEFGLAFYSALIGLALLVLRPLFGRKFRAEHLLVTVWSLFLISMALTQVRFNYYLVVAVAVLNAYFVAVAMNWLTLPDNLDSLRDIETYQVIALGLVLMMLFVPLLPPMADSHAAAAGGNTGPHPESVTWEDSNEWMAENTPEPGDWGDATSSDQLDYNGYYEYSEDGTFDYPEGSYGVLSWWDYGHLINVQDERMAHSNPFQSHADSSSAFLTAQSEERAELILDAIAAGEEPTNETNEELQDIVDQAANADNEIRYVMIDDAMAAGKFPAITAWTGPDHNHYITPEDYDGTEQIDRDEVAEVFNNVPYDDTVLSSLYFNNAVGMENYRLVHENEEHATQFMSYAIINSDTDQVLTAEDGTPQVRLNQDLSSPNTFLELQQIQQHPNLEYEEIGQRETASVKTYERVEGATLSGTVDDENVSAGDVVTATLELETNTGTTFNYTQQGEVDENGAFELTVPYATDDELGVEDGYTNSAVEALEDEYEISFAMSDGEEFTVYQGAQEVSESAVINGETLDVELEEIETEDEDPADEDEDGAADDGEEAGDDTVADEEAADGETDDV
ncbi:oligosaccharyl transferase STT3 subunit [Natrialba chahannaoensis JCM 10990]|uniref:dolichyl-phosphooligosaccharide-protein glycotransferase n=1 Tax=Natrialba chahannaoensis JCM 10990 TaxID=1227492 RepID=M0AH49_9EURY|nr:oligosaccharyl transferase, archaeosortase A system-associated [Natrialba chahannaoensis]ELY96708.1 oligosaccharyl transferase STT3 subunit [Natrialba chahannaoensis JCM 10990]